MWIDTHCHLDAPEFEPDRPAVVARARQAGVEMLVLPAVRVADFERVRVLAHAHGMAYALGIHPLCTPGVGEADLDALARALDAHLDDPRLVAVGEIGLDHAVSEPGHRLQREVYVAQLRLARQRGLPVLLHVRRSADALLQGLRQCPVAGGIVHAFNGSEPQAMDFIRRGFRLGFGGAMTHERALRIRRLATELPEESLVLETDAPDIPPQWLYRTAAQREDGRGHGRNEPAQLPRIAETLAALRGWTLDRTAAVTGAQARAALPRLEALSS